MRVITIGETITDTGLASLFPQAAADQKVKTTRDDKGNDSGPKVSPDGSGRPLYSTSLQAVRLENGVPTRAERNVTIAIMEPIDIAPGVIYGFSGWTQVVHYQNDANQIAVSITAERVVPLTDRGALSIGDVLAKLAGGKH